MPGRNQRADPLPPDDRRRAIAEAVIPLLISQGASVTTRQMADAAGVAEGTIFRVFPDKMSVFHEAIRMSMDPEPIEQALAAIPQTDPPARQLEQATAVLLARGERIAALFGVLRVADPPGSTPPSSARQFVVDSNSAVLTALTHLLERHAGLLRVTPRQAAIAFRSMVFAGGHPLTPQHERPSAADIIDILMKGIWTTDTEIAGRC